MRLFLTLFLITLPLFASSTLFEKIEKLDVGMGEYKLAKKLNTTQKNSAKKNPLKTNSDKTYQFKDGDIYVTVDMKSDRAIVLYKIFKDQNATELKRVLGGTVLTYGEPTVMSHGNIVYWVYGDDGSLVTKDDYEQWRDKQLKSDDENASAHGVNYSNLEKLYTIKLSSTKMFESADKFDDAKAYLIISSEKLLIKIVKD